MRLTLAAAIMCVGVPGCALSDTPADIREASGIFAEALNSGDAQAVAALHTEDAKIMPSNQPLFEGRSGAQNVWQGMFDAGVCCVKLEIIGVDVFGDKGNEYGLWRAKAPDGEGGQVEINGKYVHIWRNEADGWRMRADIWNDSPAE